MSITLFVYEINPILSIYIFLNLMHPEMHYYLDQQIVPYFVPPLIYFHPFFIISNELSTVSLF